MKLLLKIAQLEKIVCVYLGLGSKIQCMHCYRLNEALEKTKVGPYRMNELVKYYTCFLNAWIMGNSGLQTGMELALSSIPKC